jgi:VanZ family protein
MSSVPESRDAASNHSLPGAAGGWIPVIAWVAMLFILSTSLFSPVRTGAVVEPLIRWFAPGISGQGLDIAHGLIRKAAHFFVYGVLFYLLMRGPLRGREGHALLVCVVVAFLDEGHQRFVPGRMGSLYDIALNISGALFARFSYAAVNEVRLDTGPPPLPDLGRIAPN